MSISSGCCNGLGDAGEAATGAAGLVPAAEREVEGFWDSFGSCGEPAAPSA